ncbi:MAG: family 16 glycoside hydrolase [Verrucomicrobiia bacterium]
MKKAIILAVLIAGYAVANLFAASNPFIGNWALTIPGGGAGWLGIKEEGGKLTGSILWGGGSVVPVSSVSVQGDTLIVTRVYDVKRKDSSGKVVNAKEVETIRAKLDGDNLALTTERDRGDGKPSKPTPFTGKRIPPLPPKPDLTKVKFGEPIVLFNGKDLTGWRLTDPNAVNGWVVEEGILRNKAEQEQGKPHKNYGNLRTDREFEDFNLKLEVRVPKGGNSGIYLRGIYEVQVADSYGKPADSHGMGGLYSRITPKVNAAKPAGEWNSYDITLVNRHVTVILNGEKVIDNEPLLGCTGGALWSDEFRPGPIYLQGDHTSVDYRNIVIRPVLK